jgi:hypothetical protein
MYFSANAGDNFHLWRQRSPDGKPEQLTSGPTGEEGIAMAADGRSLITAIGLRQRPVTFHDASGDRQVSLEGYAFLPKLFLPGRKVCYRISKPGMTTQESEVWVADLDAGRTEALLPGFRVTYHDVSADGRVLVCALDGTGKPRPWLARLDRRSAPRQIPNTEALRAVFGPPGEIVVQSDEGAKTFLFRLREDGAERRKANLEPLQEIYSASQDGRWVTALGPVPGGEAGTAVFAYSTTGSGRIRLCDPPCWVRWAPDGKFLYFGFLIGYMNAGGLGRTYVLPTRPGTLFPDLPQEGFRSQADLAKVPGVRIIEAADVFPGPTPDVYVFSRESVQRNLYRIPLP